MKCPKCYHPKSSVTQTRKHASEGILRSRKCGKCEAIFSTLESIHDESPKVGRARKEVVSPPLPLPTLKDNKTTKQDAALIKKIKTEIRRKNEDLQRKKLKVPSYFIEDEDY